MFSAVDSFDEIALDYPTTIASPKKYLLPAKETLFEFDAENNEVTDYTDEVRPRVLFGVHACDINGLQNLSSVFNDPRYPDPLTHAALRPPRSSSAVAACRRRTVLPPQ